MSSGSSEQGEGIGRVDLLVASRVVNEERWWHYARRIKSRKAGAQKKMRPEKIQVALLPSRR
jgi:hypothetical protein